MKLYLRFARFKLRRMAWRPCLLAFLLTLGAGAGLTGDRRRLEAFLAPPQLPANELLLCHTWPKQVAVWEDNVLIADTEEYAVMACQGFGVSKTGSSITVYYKPSGGAWYAVDTRTDSGTAATDTTLVPVP